MATITERLAKFERRRSSAAVWSQKLALFAVPYLAIVIIGHRIDAVETIPTLWLLALVPIILIAALVLGARGIYELWAQGRKGGVNSARGIALSIVLLAPFVYQGVKAFTLPPLYDISTDLDSPPEYANALDDREDRMNEVVDPTFITRQLQLRTYPKVVARRYPLGSGRVFRAIAELVRERDWVILTSSGGTGEAPIDDEGSGLVANPTVDSSGNPLRIPLPTFRPKPNEAGAAVVEAQQVSPVGRTEDTTTNDEVEVRYVEAVATSSLFGFESDVVFRVVEEEFGTLVDMRSNSRWGPHDLGSNAERIVEFMADLDVALQGLSR